MTETTARDPWATACERGQELLAKIKRASLTRQAIGADLYNALCALRDYTDRHPVPMETASRYDMKNKQLCALVDMARINGPAESILEAFLYGQAKGYRAGLAAAKRRAGA